MSTQLKDTLLFLGIFVLIVAAAVWTWVYKQPLGLPDVWYVVGLGGLALGLGAFIVGVFRSQLAVRPPNYKRRRYRSDPDDVS